MRTFCSKIHTHEFSQICIIISQGSYPLTCRKLTSSYLDPGRAPNLIEKSEDQHFSHDLSRVAKTWNHAPTIAPSRRLEPLSGNISLGPTSEPPLPLQANSGLDTEIESIASSPISSTDRRSIGDTSKPTSPFNTVSATTTRVTSLSPLSTTSHHYNASPTLPLYDIDEDDTDPDPDSPGIQDVDSDVPDQQNNIRNLKRWPQALKIMTLTFGSLLSGANLTKVIRAGDGLVRSDAISFLGGELLQWKGMWDPSDQHALLSDDSITDHFVKISQTISILNERSVMDRIRLLFYRILLYQYYVRIQLEVKESQLQKQQGIGIASYAVEFLLKRLYDDYLDLTDKKKRRKRLLHRQIRLGKRLTRLSGYLGLGILLSASDEAMMLM